MPQWTLEHRVFAYDSFVKSGGSLIETQRLFRCRFNNGRHGNIPSCNTILRWLTSFRARGTTKKKPRGPVATARTLENVERMREAVVESNLFCSATCYRIGNERKHGRANLTQTFGIPSLQNDDRSDVKRRGLSTTFSLRRANARNYRRTWGHDHHDEWWSTFPPKRFSKQTELLILGRTKPHEVHQRPLHSPEVTVWCAVGKVGVIGPHFF